MTCLPTFRQAQDFKWVINDLNMTKPVSIAFGWGSLHTLPQSKFYYLLKTKDLSADL